MTTSHITVNGIQIIESLKKSKRNSDRLVEKFNKSLSVFPEEKQTINLQNIFDEYRRELDIQAALEEFQQAYNMKVKINIENPEKQIVEITLTAAVKQFAFYTKMSSMWNGLITNKNKTRYELFAESRDGTLNVKDPSKIYKISTYTYDEAANNCEKYADYTSRLRSAISKANNTIVDMDSGIIDRFGNSVLV